MQDREKTTSVGDQRMTMTMEEARRLIAEATGKFNDVCDELERLRNGPNVCAPRAPSGWRGVDDLYDAVEVLESIDLATGNVIEELHNARLRHDLKWPSSPEKAKITQAFLTNKMMVLSHSITLRAASVPATPIVQYDIAPL